MKYNSDFKFYLLPSNSVFSYFLKDFEYEEDVPFYGKKDFDPIIKIAVDNNTFSTSMVYADAAKIIDILQNQLSLLTNGTEESLDAEKKIKKLIEKTYYIISSHMGVPLLKALYDYDFAASSDKRKVEAEINTSIKANNCPLEGKEHNPKLIKTDTNASLKTDNYSLEEKKQRPRKVKMLTKK